MDKLFIIKRSGGSFDDAYTDVLFVTYDENLAKKYCDKANDVFQRINLRYKEVYDELEKEDDLDDERHKLLIQWWCKLHNLGDVNKHFYEPIEIR